jgi:hypothetical protein
LRLSHFWSRICDHHQLGGRQSCATTANLRAKEHNWNLCLLYSVLLYSESVYSDFINLVEACHWNITVYFELNKITLIVKSALCCLECVPKHWVSDTFGLHGHAEWSIQGFHQNFTKVSSLYTLIGRQPFSFYNIRC